MPKDQKPSQIVIPNGERFRKWVIFAITLLILVVGGAIAWANLGTDIQRIDTKIATEIATVNTAIAQNQLAACTKIREVDNKISIAKTEGTPFSRSNRDRIIGNEKDLKHIKDTVDDIKKLVKEIADRP